MDVKSAKEIVQLLARGIHPVTGEVFQDDSPYNHPTIIRALFIAAENIRIRDEKHKKTIEEKQQDNINLGRPRNAGLPWTDELRAKVAAMFSSGATIKEMADHFERTEGAILSELARQGLIKREPNPFGDQTTSPDR